MVILRTTSDPRTLVSSTENYASTTTQTDPGMVSYDHVLDISDAGNLSLRSEPLD